MAIDLLPVARDGEGGVTTAALTAPIRPASIPRNCAPVRRLNSVCEEDMTRLGGMVITGHLRRIQGINIEQPRLAGLSASEGRRRGCLERREGVADHRAVRRRDRGEGLVEEHG